MPSLSSKWNSFSSSFAPNWGSDYLKKIASFPLAILAAYGIYRATRSQKTEPTTVQSNTEPIITTNQFPEIPLVPKGTDKSVKAKALKYITRWNYSKALTPGANDVGKADSLLYAGIGSMFLIRRVLNKLNKKPSDLAKKGSECSAYQAEKTFDHYVIKNGNYKDLSDNTSHQDIESLKSISWQPIDAGLVRFESKLVQYYIDNKLQKLAYASAVNIQEKKFSKTDFWIYRITNIRNNDADLSAQSAYEACGLLQAWKKNTILFQQDQALKQAADIACETAKTETVQLPRETQAKQLKHQLKKQATKTQQSQNIRHFRKRRLNTS